MTYPQAQHDALVRLSGIARSREPQALGVLTVVQFTGIPCGIATKFNTPGTF